MDAIPNHKGCVLLIDDSFALSQILEIGLGNFGYSHESLAGVREFTERSLIGFDYQNRSKTVNLLEQQFLVALVDGHLGTESKRGVEIVPFLRQFDVMCLGVSTNPEENEALEKAGCFKTVLKGMLDWVLPDLALIVEIARAREEGQSPF